MATSQCWGVNAKGQLGLGDTINRGGPGNLSAMGNALPYVELGLGDEETVVSLDCGNEHTCVVLTSGKIKVCVCICFFLVCFGSNFSRDNEVYVVLAREIVNCVVFTLPVLIIIYIVTLFCVHLREQ